MMRKCHLNTCPVGIATQDPLLRKKFAGKPESVVNFFFLLAEEVREYMAQLGIKTIDELVGRADLLEINTNALHSKNKGIDLTALLTPANKLNPTADVIKKMDQDHLLHQGLDNYLIEQSQCSLNEGIPVKIESIVTNLNRSVGTMLSYYISKKYGREGLPDDTIHVKLIGHGGQSMGFALAKGIFIEIEGDSNDYVGKGLSGGKIAIYPNKQSTFLPQDNVIVGNVCLYGATSGEAYFHGIAGERFAVRNSGALAVCEGVGDHGCEYMTGGHVVILGKTGRNFAAGMSGGIAYIYDPLNEFSDRCNMGMVVLENIHEDSIEGNMLKKFITQHHQYTNSMVASQILSLWSIEIKHFVKVMPLDYKRVLEQQALEKAQEALTNALSELESPKQTIM